jgi:hypothetical protein
MVALWGARACSRNLTILFKGVTDARDLPWITQLRSRVNLRGKLSHPHGAWTMAPPSLQDFLLALNLEPSALFWGLISGCLLLAPRSHWFIAVPAPGQNSLPLLRLQNLAPHQNKVLQYGCDRPGTMGGQVRDFAAACWVNNGHSRKFFFTHSVVARFRIRRPKLAQCQSTKPRSVLARVYAAEV